MSSNSKKSFALVRVSNLDGSAPFSPRTFVTLHRRRYVVRSRGSSDNQGESVATLDCPGVSKKAHLEINAKMQPMVIKFIGKSIMQRAQVFLKGESRFVEVRDKAVPISLDNVRKGVVVSMIGDRGPFWSLQIHDVAVAQTSHGSGDLQKAAATPDVIVDDSLAANATKVAATGATVSQPPAKGWGMFRRMKTVRKSNVVEVLRSVSIPQGWSIVQNSLLCRQFGCEAWPEAGKVAAFDFDDTLATMRGNGSSKNPLHLVHPSVPSRLRELHRRGFQLAIFTNQDMTRFKNPATIQASVSRKLQRLEAFVTDCMSKGVEAAPPILILCATARDHNRKGCTTKPDDEGGTGFWDCCEKLWETAASKRQPSRKLNKSASFYVGNAAGRFRDHSDCDKYLAKRVGIHFFTETEFFALRDIDAVVKAVTAASAPATDSDDVISPSAVEALPSQHDVLQNIAVSGLSWDSSKQSLGPIQFAGHFANALGEFIKEQPSQQVKERILFQNELCVLFYDGYPKSRMHLLLVPRLSFLNKRMGVGDLTAADLPKLKLFHAIADHICTQLKSSMMPSPTLRTGYHMVPSLYQLHLHIFSDDFDSPHLKKKKHWNSFTSDFLVPPRVVEQTLRSDGKFCVDRKSAEAILKQPLACHICRQPQKNMPTLKEHIRTCARTQQPASDDCDGPPSNKRWRRNEGEF